MNYSDKYTCRIEWSETDNCFIARCLEFPSISVHGNSQTKALNELNIALRDVIEWMEEDGDKIPEPFGVRDYKGNISLRVPCQTHKDVAIAAAEQRLSINQFLNSLIEKNLSINSTEKAIADLRHQITNLRNELSSLTQTYAQFGTTFKLFNLLQTQLYMQEIQDSPTIDQEPYGERKEGSWSRSSIRYPIDSLGDREREGVV